MTPEERDAWADAYEAEQYRKRRPTTEGAAMSERTGGLVVSVRVWYDDVEMYQFSAELVGPGDLKVRGDGSTLSQAILALGRCVVDAEDGLVDFARALGALGEQEARTCGPWLTGKTNRAVIYYQPSDRSAR